MCANCSVAKTQQFSSPLLRATLSLDFEKCFHAVGVALTRTVAKCIFAARTDILLVRVCTSTHDTPDVMQLIFFVIGRTLATAADSGPPAALPRTQSGRCRSEANALCQAFVGDDDGTALSGRVGQSSNARARDNNVVHISYRGTLLGLIAAAMASIQTSTTLKCVFFRFRFQFSILSCFFLFG